MVVFGPIWPVSKNPKRPTMSSFIARDPQNCPSSHQKKNQLLTVLAKLAQNERVQKRIILSGWANLSFPKTKMTPTEV